MLELLPARLLAPELGRNSLPGELIEIVVINAEGRLIVQTIWLEDRRRGRRRSNFESFGAAAPLMQRLAELVPELCRWDPGLDCKNLAPERGSIEVAAARRAAAR
jgi:hypothetical protein